MWRRPSPSATRHQLRLCHQASRWQLTGLALGAAAMSTGAAFAQSKHPEGNDEAAARAAHERRADPKDSSPDELPDVAEAAAEGEREAAAEPAREVVVRGAQSQARRAVSSPEAIQVVDTRRARERGADLGEVLARVPGVSFRRSGGLGAPTRLSLGGLEQEQIRVFIDGVPLELAGYPFGVGDVPPSFVDRVAVLRGVVPLRYGVDALGGALDLQTEPPRGTRVAATYQVGSYGVRRGTLSIRSIDLTTGLYATLSGQLDVAKNDYPVDVREPDATGRLRDVQVRRARDAYAARGASFEVGVLDRALADRVSLRVTTGAYEKELPHNQVMTVPYGEVEYTEASLGVTGRSEHQLSDTTRLEALLAINRRHTTLSDQSRFIYDFSGRRLGPRVTPGEIDSEPIDRRTTQHLRLARLDLAWQPSDAHTLRFVAAPSLAERSGHDRFAPAAARDPATAERSLAQLVLGVEHTASLGQRLDFQADDFGSADPLGRLPDLFVRERDDLLANALFVKAYYQRAEGEEVLAGMFRPLTKSTLRLGVGDGARLRLLEPWTLKASYELATRLPQPDETFGDGRLVVANLELEPETSHNLNLGTHLELRRTPAGAFTLGLEGSLRQADRLIVLLGGERLLSHQNVFAARALGLDASLSWAAPTRWLFVDAGGTLQDVRNRSKDGPFAAFFGDRIPHRPWLFGSLEARAVIRDLPMAQGQLEPFYSLRYVHEFERSWSSVGAAGPRQRVPAQLGQHAGLSYRQRHASYHSVLTLELENLTDAPLYDVYGVTRPGRAIKLTWSAEIDG